MNRLYFDTETTGMIKWDKPSRHPAQPKVLQLAALLVDKKGKVIGELNELVRPEPGTMMEEEALKVHGITLSHAHKNGISRELAYDMWANLLRDAGEIIGHNIAFDIRMMRITARQIGLLPIDDLPPQFCTMHKSTSIIKLPKMNGKGFKVPTLCECAEFFFKEKHEEAHDAMADVKMCKRIREILVNEY